MSQAEIRVTEPALMTPGHLGCQGCGAALAMKYVLGTLGEKTIIVIPASCWSIIAGPFPYSALKVPVLHTAFETAAIAASGVRAALDTQGDTETTVMAWAGDGGTFDIGLQALSGAAERNENILYVCYDNEAYMNTGIQRSSATPWGAWTTTTPNSKLEYKKDIMQIVAAHGVPYAATASVAYPEDLSAKTLKAKEMKGFRFLHVFAPCPTGWKAPSELSVQLARLAVKTRVFPLYEVESGTSYTLGKVDQPLPIDEYIKLQGRFNRLEAKDLEMIQKSVESRWALLERRAQRQDAL